MYAVANVLSYELNCFVLNNIQNKISDVIIIFTMHFHNNSWTVIFHNTIWLRL